MLRPLLFALSRLLPPLAAGAPVAAKAPRPAFVSAYPVRPSEFEKTFGAVTLRVRPSHARPGELFEIEARADAIQGASAKFAGATLRMYEAAPGVFRGYGAVPLTKGAGPDKVSVRVEEKDLKPVDHDIELPVDTSFFPEHTLKVEAKYTSPSKKDAQWMKEDNAAFLKAYDLPFEKPLFTRSFFNPREGSEYNSRYGERRTFNGKVQSRHMGLDLDGKTGEPILAANDGVVRMVRPCFGSGNTVLLHHGAGLFTGYFHLSEFAVKEGETVKRGQLLGKVGKTGRVTGPHLHLAVKVNGLQVDPESLLTFDFFPGQKADAAPVVVPTTSLTTLAAPVEAPAAMTPAPTAPHAP